MSSNFFPQFDMFIFMALLINPTTEVVHLYTEKFNRILSVNSVKSCQTIRTPLRNLGVQEFLKKGNLDKILSGQAFELNGDNRVIVV